MFNVVIHERGGEERTLQFDKGEITVGRVQGNDIILPKGNVSKRHSRIVYKDDRFVVVDLKSTNGTYVNGRRLTSPLVVKPNDKIYIGDFVLMLEHAGAARDTGASDQPTAVAEDDDALVREIEAEAARDVTAPQGPVTSAPAPAVVAQAARRAEREASLPAAPAPAPVPAPHVAAQAAASAPAPARREPPRPPADAARASTSGGFAAPGPMPPSPPTAGPTLGPDDLAALVTLMRRVGKTFDVTDASVGSLHDQQRWSRARSTIAAVLGDMVAEGLVDDRMDQEALTRAALREAVSLGALDDLLAHKGVREIVVEGPSHVVADFGRGLEPVSTKFSSADQLLVVARRLVASAGDALPSNRPIHETALPDGSRVIVVQPPVAVRGPVIEVRRASTGTSLTDLVGHGLLDDGMANLLRKAVEKRRNVLVAGPVGSGVTTLLGALAATIPSGERIVTVEDVPDLALHREHVVALATGGTESGLTLRDLLAQASRLRSDRLVVDDVRGPEALDVLTTLAARRDGCLVGLHAGGSTEGIAHLRTLARIDHPLSDAAMDELVASAVHVVVRLGRDAEGERRVLHVQEVRGLSGGKLDVQTLVERDGDGFRERQPARFT